MLDLKIKPDWRSTEDKLHFELFPPSLVLIKKVEMNFVINGDDPLYGHEFKILDMIFSQSVVTWPWETTRQIVWPDDMPYLKKEVGLRAGDLIFKVTDWSDHKKVLAGAVVRVSPCKTGSIVTVFVVSHKKIF